LQEEVRGKIDTENFRLLLAGRVSVLCAGYATNEEIMRQELIKTNDEIERIKNSLSWKLTKPLRFVTNLPSFFFKKSKDFQ
jgi:hypothetical protein